SHAAFFGSSPHPRSFMHLQRLYIRIVEVYRQKFLQYTGEARDRVGRSVTVVYTTVYPANSSSNASASCKSAVSKPSVNQSSIGANSSRANRAITSFPLMRK